MSKLTIGDMAPDFTLPADTGEEITLSGLRGKKVVLYFYPKDNTSGCTAQACEFTALEPQFTAKDAVIFGVSRDSLKSHANFKQKHSLGFPLLSDPDHAVHEAYGAWGEKKMYGKTVLGAIRSTFVIDEDGKIVSAEYKVKAKGNAATVLEGLS